MSEFELREVARVRAYVCSRVIVSVHAMFSQNFGVPIDILVTSENFICWTSSAAVSWVLDRACDGYRVVPVHKITEFWIEHAINIEWCQSTR